MLRRQEQLKQKVLKDAQAYREVKAERERQRQEDSQKNVIQIGNVKFAERGAMSPARDKTTINTSTLTSPKVSMNRSRIQPVPVEDEKTSEEKAEEKKKMDMMRKFYRNRHSSFLQALAEQKAKKEQDEKAVREKE